MTGFGFKNGNDFHLVGLRGDGSAGVDRYQVYGTNPNGWNKQTGHTVADGGASTNGSQAGPNWMRLITASDGATYNFQTSGDSGATWNDELTGQTPSPFTNISGVVTFGIALWFNNADTGPFSIDIAQFADEVVFEGVLAYGNADIAGAGNFDGDPHTQPWNTDDIDSIALHDTGSNTSRITIPAGLNGRYGIFTANVNTSVAGGRWYFGIMKGGSPNYVVLMESAASGGAVEYEQFSTGLEALATGDIWELVCFSSAAGSLTRLASSSFSLMVVA